MRKRHVARIVAVLVGSVVAGVLLWGPLGQVRAQAPTKKQEVIETRAQKGEKAKYPGGEVKNKQEGESIAKRQGPYTCDVVFVNKTSWWIHRVYVDGRSVGSMAPGGEYILRDVTSGPTELYAEADFRDGSLRFWGPRIVNCPSWTVYTWSLLV